MNWIVLPEYYFLAVSDKKKKNRGGKKGKKKKECWWGRYKCSCVGPERFYCKSLH